MHIKDPAFEQAADCNPISIVQQNVSTIVDESPAETQLFFVIGTFRLTTALARRKKATVNFPGNFCIQFFF